MIDNSNKIKIYNSKNAFNVIVNIHLIYMLYRKMGKVKSDIFSKYDFYDDILHISRQRFFRLCRGENFQISKKEREDLAALFHIDEKYFVAGGDWMVLHTVSELDWKCYFNVRYERLFTLNVANKVELEIGERIDKFIEETIKKKLIESTYDVNEPLYRVYYYFKRGVSYTEETQLAKFTRELTKMKIKDWDEMLTNEMELARYSEMLDKHNRYIQSVLTCLQLKKE